MTNTPSSGPKIPTERADPKEAGGSPGAGSQDRPGFDLGGSSDPSTKEAAGLTEGGPKGSTSSANAGSDASSDPTDGTNGPA